MRASSCAFVAAIAAAFLGLASRAYAVATTLAPGDIAIIGYNSDGTDDFSFVLLRDIGSGTQINFTDKGWLSSGGFSNFAGDSTVTFTAPSNLSAGTVIASSNPGFGGATLDLDAAGDQIIAYQGTAASPTLLYAIDFADGNTSFAANATNANTSALPSGLTLGSTAVAVSQDNAYYVGPTTNTQATLLARIGNVNEWTGSNNNGVAGTANHLTAQSGPFFVSPDSQVWVAASGGGSAIVHIDSNGGAASNAVQLYNNFVNPDSTNTFYHPTDIAFDTVEGLYFVADSDGTHDRILQGSIAQALDTPGSVPTLTVLYSEAVGNDGIGITGIAVDTLNNIVYFTEGTKFEKVSYNTAGQTPVILADLGTNNFTKELALDLAHNTVAVVNTATSSQFDPMGHVITTVSKNYIYLATNLTSASGANSVTFTKLPMSPSEPTQNSNFFPAGHGKILSVDIDSAARKLYFTTVPVIDPSTGVNGDGGVWTYNLTGNATGTYTNLFTETANTSINGALGFIKVKPEEGRYYLSDAQFASGNVDQSAVYVHALSAGTPTLFQVVQNVNGLAPDGLAIDAQPTLSITNASATFTEPPGSPGTPTAVTLITAATASDPDPDSNGQLAGAAVRISTGFLQGSDTLTISNATSGTVAGTSISFNYNSSTGVMTFTGVDTFAHYQTALTSVQFKATGDNPTKYGTDTSRVLAFTVNDGLLDSDIQTATVTVVAVNDPPINTVPGAQVVNEDTNLSITGLSISDPDADPATQQMSTTLSVSNGTLTVSSAGGAAASGSGTATVTLTGTSSQINTTLSAASNIVYRGVQDYFGSDTLTVTTNDGGNTGTGGALQDQDTVGITVNPVNDPPTLTAISDPAAILEDAGQQTVNLSGITSGPANESNQTLTVTATSGNTALIPNPTVTYTSANTTGSLSYTPVANANGSAIITVTVTDSGGTANGGVNTFQRQFTVNVTPVNDQPTVDAIGDVTILEDAAQQTVNLSGISSGPPNESTQTLSVTATSDNTTLIPNPTVTYTSPNATGSLKFTPVANQNGSANITVTVQDNGGTANGGVNTITRQFAVNVTAVNDAPTLDAIANPASIPEDSGQQTIGLSGISPGPANEVGQTLTVTATSGNTSVIPDPTVTYTSPNATGSLSYTPVANANGSAVITVTVKDNGGTANGGVDTFTRQFTVNVTPVNDPPSITGQMPIAIGYNSSRTIQFSDLQVTDIDNSYPTGFTLTVSPGANYSLGGNTVTPVTNFFGTLTVPVKVNDGAADSNTYNLVVTVNPAPQDVISKPGISKDAGGGYMLSFIGNPGQQYTVQYSDSLAPPNWQTLGTMAADSTGHFSILDNSATGMPHRFYRLLVPYFNDFNAALGPATLRGTATWTNQSVLLTDIVAGQIGAVVFNSTATSGLNGFTAKFNLALGPSPGTPADGASFAVGDLGTNAWSEAGPGTAHSLAIGFDTFNNGTPEGNIGIHVWVNGTHLTTNVTNPYTSGVVVPVEVSFDTTNGLTVKYNSATIFNNIAIAGFVLQAGDNFGVSARTGGSVEKAIVDDAQVIPR